MEDFVARPSRVRVAGMVAGSAVFVAAGLGMAGAFGAPPARAHSPVYVMGLGWVCVVFFGLCGIAWGRKLFDGREQLRIGAAGIRWTPWSDQVIPWPEIRDVTTWQTHGQKMILLHLHHPARFPGRGVLAVVSGLNRKLSGGDVCISLNGTDRSFSEAWGAVARFRG